MAVNSYVLSSFWLIFLNAECLSCLSLTLGQLALDVFGYVVNGWPGEVVKLFDDMSDLRWWAS